MLKILVTAAALTLSAVAAPALAQEAAPAAAEAPSLAPEAAALLPQVQGAAQGLEAAVADLMPRAQAVRADASLSDADKRTRVDALVSEKQAQLDAFNTALAAFLTAQARAHGTSDAEIQAAIPMVQAQVRQQMIAELMGEGDQ